MNIYALMSRMHPYISSGHDLGKAITEVEADSYIPKLIQRLETTTQQLDQTVRSLEKLEQLLINYVSHLGLDVPDLDTEESILFVREVASYIGKTFVMNSAGQWIEAKTFVGTSIEYRYSSKGEPLHPYRYLRYPLWSLTYSCVLKASQNEYAHLDKVLQKEKRRKPRSPRDHRQ